ncbi:MAG: DNA methyltransferase [Candidatus Scalindua sp.]
MSKTKIDLDGKTWLQYSISIWSDIRKSGEENGLSHPAIFPNMLPERLIKIYSNEGDLVFDPFAGSGSTLIAAKNLRRFGKGIELSEQFIKLYKQRTNNLNLFDDHEFEPELAKADARNLCKYIEENSVQLTITSPPYWDILNQKRTADYKEARKYSDFEADLGNIESYETFLANLKDIFSAVYQVTKKDGFCCVVVMDLRKKDKFYPFHMHITDFMLEIGFRLDDTIIWDRRQEYNNLRPLGYPYVFRINKVHEFILIFKK